MSHDERVQMQRFAAAAENNLWGTCCRHTRDSLCYFGELFSLTCAPDLLALGLFPNAKELTESFAAYRAVRDYLTTFSPQDREVTLVAVGDGGTPRTAATFAFRTAWKCVSVDPVLDARKRWDIVRLEVHAKRIEEVSIEAKRAVVVAVHSHARLPAALASIKAEQIAVVAIPCCIPQVLDRDHDHYYVDNGILSPQRGVYIWENVA
jgi:hypothetical protein